MLLVKFSAALLFPIITIVSTAASNSNSSCASSKFFVGSCNDDWHSAFAACALHGMELVVIDSFSKQKEVEQVINTCEPREGMNKGFWIGAYLVGNPGKWTWLTTGKETRYTKWGPGQPNMKRGKGRCVEVYKEPRTESYFWNDLPCDEVYVNKRYVCQNKMCLCHTN